MSNEEKSLFDEVWDAAGLTKEQAPVEEPASIEVTEEFVEPSTNEESIAEEPAMEQEPIEPAPEEEPEEPAEEPKEEPEAPAEEPSAPNEHTVKKKSVKFLVVYTIAFVLVVAALISGSYMISSRLQQELEGNEGASQSKLENIQDKNAALKKENAAVKKENEELTASQTDADELIAGAGDMVEHNEYLAAAMDAYIAGNRADARAIYSTVDREKLSPTFQGYYDALGKRLG